LLAEVGVVRVGEDDALTQGSHCCAITH
jgi:hypothetical protein